MNKSSILIVEDERILSKDLVKYLGDYGYTIVGVAHSGEMAVRKAMDLVPDLVLMDIVLDGKMDGIDAAEIIKKEVDSAVVYLTAHPEEDIFKRAKVTEPSAFLTKPISPTDLIRTVEMALHKREIEQRLRKSEQRLDLAIRGAGLGMWDWDLINGRINVNHLWLEMMDYSKGNSPLTDSEWQEKIHPNEQNKAKQKFIDYIKGKTENYECEARFKSGKGDWRWILIKGGISERENNGKVVRATGILQDINVRKLAEQALEQSEKRYRTLFELSPNGIILYINGKIALANKASARTLQADDSLDLLGKSALEIVDPEYHDLARSRFESLSEEGDCLDPTIIKYMKMDGATAWVETSETAFNFFDKVAVLSVFREITSEILAKQALSQNEEKHRNIVTSIEEGYYELDLDGMIMFCNDSLARTFSSTIPELINTKLKDYFSASDHNDFEEALGNAISKQKPLKSTLWSFTRPNGENGSMEVSVSVLKDSAGDVCGFCGICRDVTERRKSEELMLRSARLEAVAELATGVAHNFNNLLQIVMSASHLAIANLETGAISQAKESLKIIGESSSSGAETVKKLQEFANVRKNGGDKGFEIFDLSKTALHALEMGRSMSLPRPGREAPRVNISSNLTEGCFINGNQGEIFQVVINLIKNALESIQDVGEVSIRTFNDGGEVFLEVLDTGAGVPNYAKSKIFEPFWTTKGGYGAGMGLAGSYGVIQRHNGSINFEDRKDGGTVFQVVLPLAQEIEEVRKRSLASVKPSKERLTILLVDDMPLVLDQLKEGFENLKHEVITSDTGEGAIEIMNGNLPDAVICDLGLPGISGWQVGKRLKEICEELSVEKPPFVILTGWAGQIDSVGKSEEYGVDHILEKPATVGALMKLLSGKGD